MKKVVVHFSGGTDSTLTAALYAEQNYEVHLASYDRISFIGVKSYTQKNYKNLCRIYGKDKFQRVVLPVGKWHKILNYENYLKYAKKYKLAIVVMNFSKLAMHWHSLVYCLQNDIHTVADGATPYMNVYPDQNKAICLDKLKIFYNKFGISHENPVWHLCDQAEQLIYDRGVTESPAIRGTSDDLQVFYAEQFVFALFVKYYTTKHGYEKYEKYLSNLYADKLSFMEDTVREWQSKGKGTLIDRLLN